MITLHVNTVKNLQYYIKPLDYIKVVSTENLKWL